MTGVVVAGILLFLIGICMLASLPLIHPRRVVGAHSPAEYTLRYEDIVMTTSDGIRLRGWWIPAENSDRTVILLHGYAGTMDPDLQYAPPLVSAGFNVLMFDFRAHGRSGGTISTLGAREVRDVQTAVDEAKRHGSRRVGLLGFSMGGRAAILSVSKVPGIHALISDCAPPRLHYAVTRNLILRKIPDFLAWLLASMMLFGGSLLSGANLFRQDPLYAAEHLPGLPVFFMQGGLDRYVRRSELTQMVEQAGKTARLWYVDGAKHRDIEKTHPTEYLRNVIHFFQEAL